MLYEVITRRAGGPHPFTPDPGGAGHGETGAGVDDRAGGDLGANPAELQHRRNRAGAAGSGAGGDSYNFV